jgi:ATP-dependent DNA helicase PIF1
MIFTDSFNKALSLLEKGENIFINGPAGSGKSTFLNYIRNNTDKKLAVLAPTGVAALQVGGETIHRFFRFRPGMIDPNSLQRKGNSALYKKLQLLIIDEISMVRADLFDGIEAFLRKFGSRPGQVFGGVQILVIGDLFQIPPIVTENEADLYFNRYESPYFFASNAYKQANLCQITFEKIFRQENEGFINLLNKIRDGETGEEVLREINKATNHKVSGNVVTLTTRNANADSINRRHIDAISTAEHKYKGIASGELENNESRLPAPMELRLKSGAQVMFTKNNPDGKWVNGTLGKVVNCFKDSVEIETEDGIFKVEPETWESVKYELVGEKISQVVVGSFKQLPLILAWAVTIHKSQGKTLDKAVIDLAGGAFASGQLYVALSRCRKFEDVSLTRPIRSSDIKADMEVKRFFERA